MSLYRTLDRTSAVSHTSPQPVLTFLYPDCLSKYPRRAFCRIPSRRPPRLTAPAPHGMDNFFIQALARAGTCHEHQRPISTLRNIIPPVTKYHKPRRRSSFNSERREFESTKAGGGPFKRIRRFAKEELQALVHYYGINLEPESGPESDFREDGPLVWNVGDDHEPWPVKDGIHMEYIQRIAQLLKDETSSHEEIFRLYKLLPAPGVVYLTSGIIRGLLHHLSVVERPDPITMQRFLSILDDMKNAHIHIIRSEWTSAIYLAGRCMGKVSADEVQAALYIWKDMEKRAGIKGGAVTMSVLFDVAVKAGKYTLAETFLKEMQTRKLKFHRHFRVSLLYYYGVMLNGDGVRRTYQQLVSSGDVVDTVVINSVIAALFRAGEPAAAEHVFERMKRLHNSRMQARSHVRNWRERRLLGLDLTHEGRKVHESGDPELQKEFQKKVSIAPDSRTYGLLIRHYASVAGNIDRVQELLREMQYNEIPMDGTIFIVILYGFSSFGGVRYSSWTRDKLESIWKLYIQCVEARTERTWLSALSVIVALKAFKKCTDADRTLQAWYEVRRIWDPTSEETQKVLRALRKLIPRHPFFSENM